MKSETTNCIPSIKRNPLHFRMCGVSSTLVSYLRRISDVRVAYLAYQWRMCYVCDAYVSLLWSMCGVLEVLEIFCGAPRESFKMILYTRFRFSEVMDQMFLKVRGAVQGSFRAKLGVAFVFVHVVLRPG